MEGGSEIGAGTYGCVYDQPLRIISPEDGTCIKHPSTKGVVAKITESEEAANEIDAAKVIAHIPNYRDYFSVPDPESIEKPCALKEQTDEPDLKDCPIVKVRSMSHMLHFTLPYAGKGLTKHFAVFLKENKVMPVEKIITHLLEGAAQLALYNYVHLDIHRGNILFDDETSMPRIIDFGFSFSARNITAETVKTRWKVYTPNFPYEPPEITVATGFRKQISLETILHDLIQERSLFKTCQFLLQMPMTGQRDSFRRFWNNSKSIQQRDWVGLYKYYWPGFDAWSFGAILLEMYMKFANTSAYTDQPGWLSLASRIREVLRGLLKMNPVMRIDCVEALFMFNPESPILNTEAAKKWMQNRQRMRQPST